MSNSLEPKGPPAGRIARIKHDGAASAAELREFLRSVKGKSPQEVMGAMAQSSLVQSTVIATAAICMILVGASVIAYAFPSQDDAVANKQTVDENKSQGSENTDSSEAQTGADDAQDSVAGDDDRDKALDHLGIGDTKQLKPGEDPLKSLDDLLDGVK